MLYYGIIRRMRFYEVVCYGMRFQCHVMIFQCYAMRLQWYAMLFYSMVYVVKDMLGLTVIYICNCKEIIPVLINVTNTLINEIIFVHTHHVPNIIFWWNGYYCTSGCISRYFGLNCKKRCSGHCITKPQYQWSLSY